MADTKSLSAVVLGWRHFIVRTTFLSILVAVVVSLLLPQWYVSTATVLPAQEAGAGGGLAQLVSQLGGGLRGGSARATRNLLSRTPLSDMMLGILKSRRIRSGVVDKYDLVKVYDVPTREHAIRELGDHVVVNTTPEGLITVSVEDRDPQRAADMANTFLEQLDHFNRETSVEAARRSVEFIRDRLEENRDRTNEAAEKLRDFQEEHGAIEITEQTRITLEAIAELQARTVRLEIQRGVLLDHTTEDQIEVQQIDAEIREIALRLDRLMGRLSPVPAPGTRTAPAAPAEVFLPLGEIPSLALQFANLKQDVLVQKQVQEYLTAQFEEARIQMARDQETITVLDEAVPPIRKARPKRSLIVILTAILTTFAAMGIAVIGQMVLEQTDGSDSADLDQWKGLRSLVRALSRLRGWGSSPTAPPT